MISLKKEYTKLSNIIDELNTAIEEIEAKRETILNNAIEQCREMTDREQNKYDKMDEQIGSINDAIGQIENALEYLEESYN